MKYMLSIPGLKKNLISLPTLYAKRIRVAFLDDQVLMWRKGKTINDATIIREKREACTS